MRRYIAYLRYVLRHKWFVFQAGRELGVPLFNLILHDWDKFLPFMFLAYARYFYHPDGTSKREHTTKEEKDFLVAWFMHQRRNRHHWQWYLVDDFNTPARDRGILVMDSGAMYRVLLDDLPEYAIVYSTPEQYSPVKPHMMAESDVREMLADWMGAGRAVGKPDTAAWFFNQARQDLFRRVLHPATYQWLLDRLDPNWSKISQFVEKSHV